MPFSAVVTTGVYCRDGCPAAPRDEHVRPFEFAAAAEAAGFRACLRCRPYRASEPAAWVGPSELVCRAVRLILDGALDDGGTEGHLARRLGVSDRHLRRLFHEYVGATPDAVARSRRAHFARRLLDETDLPVADVGFAAGFGSVRQMNRVMRGVFRAPPTELRRRRRKADRLVADGGLELRLPFRPPLAWDAMLAFRAARATPGVEAVDGGCYRRTVDVDGAPGVVELYSPPADDHLLLRAHLPRWEGLIHVVEQARGLFDLDADPAPIADCLRRDPLLRPRVRRRPGLRVPGSWDPFELGVRAIVGQQVTVKAATTIAGRLVERFGWPVPGLERWGLNHLFPEPGVLAGGDLTGLGLPESRARTIQAFAAAVTDGLVVLDASRGLDETVARLCAVPGIGEWTANYIAMRGLGEPDAFPASDLGLRRVAGGGQPLSAADLAARAERWRPWRAYAATHLWVG